jgi:hypothetical protein
LKQSKVGEDAKEREKGERRATLKTGDQQVLVRDVE